MQKLGLGFFFIMVFACYTALVAHPVIWSGGRVFHMRMSSRLTELKTHYSWTQLASMGVHYLNLGSDKSWLMGQLNGLIYRFNGMHSQGNMYVSSGVGRMLNSKKLPALGWHFGVQTDYETRRLYTLLGYDVFTGTSTLSIIQARLGWAPYKTSFSKISTWIIMQVQAVDSQVRAMPVIRFFKRNILLELGSDFNKQSLMTVMVHW